MFKYIKRVGNIVTVKANRLVKHMNDSTADQTLYQCYIKRSDIKDPSREEQMDTIKMPGFAHPHTIHDEGYFTQKAKLQLEELKKRQDKPMVENTEKKD